jgi:hypothetical protein
MKKLNARRLLYVVVLLVAHAAAISSGAFLRHQTAYAQDDGTAKWGKRTVVDGLPACDCTVKARDCACVVELGP